MGACDLVLEKWQDDDRYHRVIRDLHLQFLLFLFKIKRRRKEGKQKGREEGRERKIIDLTKLLGFTVWSLETWVIGMHLSSMRGSKKANLSGPLP